MKRAIAILALAVAAHVALPPISTAQEMTEEQMQAWMTAVSPNENHVALEPLVGTWSHEMTLWQAPGAEPMSMTATSEAKWAMDGRYVQADYTGSMMGMPFKGRDMIGYDNLKEKYFSVWIDNVSTGPMTAWGSWDAESKTLTLEGKAMDPMTGEEVDSKSTVKFLEDGSTIYEEYMPGPDGEMFKHMEIRSTKTG